MDTNNPDTAKIEEINTFLNEFMMESDRGAALLGAAMIDDFLRKILINFLIERKSDVKDLIEGANAPLSNFSTRAKLVYCLGLISRCEFHNIEIIRSIRNKFAHQLRGISFNDVDIKRLCRKLLYDRSAFAVINLPTPRHSFTLTTAVLVANLNRRNVNRCIEKIENNDWEPFHSLSW